MTITSVHTVIRHDADQNYLVRWHKCILRTCFLFATLSYAFSAKADQKSDIFGIQVGMTVEKMRELLTRCQEDEMMGELTCLNPKGGYFIVFVTKHLKVNVVRSLLYRFCSNEKSTSIFDKIAAAYDLTNRANAVKNDHGFSFDTDGGVKASVMQSGTCQVEVPVPQYQILMLSNSLDAEDRKAINGQMSQKYQTPDFR